MRRREVLAGTAAAALTGALPAVAREPARIGVLGSGSKDAPSSVNQMTWLRSGLGGAGLAEGRDFVFAERWADGDYRRFPALAAELIGERPVAIVISTIAAAEAARGLSKTIPVVMTGLNDPVGAGLAASLARPGGNITGMATMNEDVILKLLGILPLVLPRAKRLVAIANPANPSSRSLMAAIRTEAVRLGLSIDAVEVATPAALDTAFDDIGRRRPDALLLIPDNALVALADQIVSRALARRLPTFATNPEAALAGAVVTYGYLRREAVEAI